MYGYKCTLQTDTEVITYIVDYLHRKKGLTLQEIALVIAAPFWQTIEKMPPESARPANICERLCRPAITGRFQFL